MQLNVAGYVFDTHPLPTFYFFRIYFWLSAVVTNHHVIEFMFRQSIIERGFINKMKQFLQTRFETHFFKQSAASGLHIGFTLALMTATRISPQQRRMVFLTSTLLQHYLIFIIQYKYRKSTMQKGFFVSFHFRHQTYLLVILVYQYYVLFFHILF